MGNGRLSKRLQRRALSIESLEVRRLMAFDPTGAEQELLQLTNQLRTNPQNEYSRLIKSTNPVTGANPQITNALQFFGVNVNQLRTDLAALTAVAPVIWNESLYNSAGAHNQAMLAADQQTHQAPGEAGLLQRVQNAGYPVKNVGENVFAFAQNVVETHAAFVIDWGDGPNGMQNPAGHRITMMNSIYTDVGMRILAENNSRTSVGPLLVTQDFGRPQGNITPNAVGAVFRDADSDGMYDAGEGLGAVEITFTGVAGTFTTTAKTAGGYQLALPTGTYTAIARGGGLSGTVVRTNVVSNGQHVFVNFIEGNSNALAADRMEANDDFTAAKSLTGNDESLADLTLHRSSDRDYFKLVAGATGTLKVTAEFGIALGDVDLQLYDSARRLVAQATTHTSNELLQAQITRGETYYIVALGFQDSMNLGYKLSVDVPDLPPAPAADRFEPNQSSTSPTAIGPEDVTQTNLTLHSSSDEDWFRFTAANTGPLTIDLSFTHADGDVDIQLLNSNGATLNQSVGLTNTERVTTQAEAGKTYLLKVFGKAGSLSPSYTLQVDGPGVVPPTADDDTQQINAGATTSIDLLSNDRSAGGLPLTSPTIELESAGIAGQPTWTVVGNQLQVVAPANVRGAFSNRYRVRDASGLFSAFATVRIFVVGTGVTAFQNPNTQQDVDNNNRVEPLDALVVINYLNQGRQATLPRGASSTAPWSFIDVNGNGEVEPLDALLVINRLNRGAGGEPINGEPTFTSGPGLSAIARDEDQIFGEYWNVATFARTWIS